MHHKRRRPKNRRAGCLLCKPWKMNGAGSSGDMRPIQVRRADSSTREQLRQQS